MQKLEKSQTQIEYESALSYIHQKGYDIETHLRRGKPDKVECIVMKDGEKYLDSKGEGRSRFFTFDNKILKNVARSVIDLYLQLKKREK